MRLIKSDQNCADILYAVLRPGEALTRKQIVGAGGLSNDEFGRARKILMQAQLLANVHKLGYTLRIHVLGGPPERTLALQASTETSSQQFDSLLAAWQITHPLAAVGATTYVNRRFLGDEDAGLVERKYGKDA